MASELELLEERLEGVVILCLNRPERRNALSKSLIDAIRVTSERLSVDESVTSVIFTGSEGAFCAGLDLKELGDDASNLDGSYVEAVRALPQPTIAAVNGAAVTGGLELALACDMRLGSPQALFADTHARIGVMPGGGASVMLSRLVGLGRANEMSLSGRFVSAEEAERWGLVNRIVPEAELLPASVALARNIAANPPGLVRGIKSLIAQGMDRGLEDALEHERRRFSEFAAGTFTRQDVAARRASVTERGRREVRGA